MEDQGLRPRVPLASVVIPFHNEQDNLDHAIHRIATLFKSLEARLEIVLVDDGSRDKSVEIAMSALKNLQNTDGKLLILSRNFGKEAALTAGLNEAQGDVVIPFDADMQDPPELIPSMLERWQGGYDVVYAVRTSRKSESAIKRITAFIFYRLISILSETEIPCDTGDFRLMDRMVVEALKSLPERTRYMKGIFSWVGFRQTSVTYEREMRLSGQSSWNYWKLWNLAVDAVTSFSIVPLNLIGGAGITLAIAAILYGSAIALRTMLFGVDVPGYASLMTAVLLLGAIQLIGIGALGEYIGRIFKETKQRPIYIIRQKWSQTSIHKQTQSLQHETSN